MLLCCAVNLPGYSYSITSVNGLSIVSAERCPVNTYSPGLKKQRACVPCPTGFTTKGLDGRTRPEDCSESQAHLSSPLSCSKLHTHDSSLQCPHCFQSCSLVTDVAG
jgi:hypothetical protein